MPLELSEAFGTDLLELLQSEHAVLRASASQALGGTDARKWMHNICNMSVLQAAPRPPCRSHRSRTRWRPLTVLLAGPPGHGRSGALVTDDGSPVGTRGKSEVIFRDRFFWDVCDFMWPAVISYGAVSFTWVL